MLTNHIIYKKYPVGAGWMQSLSELLARSGDIEVGLVCLSDGQYEKKTEDNYTQYFVSFERSKNPFYRVCRNITIKIGHSKWTENYLKTIDDFQPDIVHVFGTESFFVELIPRIKQPVVVHVQGILTSYMNAWFPPGGYSVFDLYRYSFRFVDYLKGQTQIQTYRRFKKMTKREQAYVGYIRYCMGRTEWDRLTMKSLNRDIRYSHVEEVLRPQFYDAERWDYQESGKLRLISFLSPSMYKGFDLILKTATILKNQDIDFEWKVCGTDESDNIVHFYDKKLRVDHKKLNVKYLGRIPADNIIHHMQSSDMYIHPSYIENSPNSVCEAQILGMPVIATDVGGVSSLIQNGKTGILIPANDPYYLSRQIMELKNNESYIRELSVNAREVALKRHDRNKILEDIKNVYSEILSERL